MRRRLELRDLRSLERRSMYSIFHPLDVDERLPRELILEGRRYRWLELRHIEILGFVYLPLLILTVVVLGSFSMALAFAVAGVAFAAVFAYVLSAKYR
jgi:TRAP-type mannitol/chloroaromatic compound transport system permease large subunit